jgi:DNA polymerase-4
LHLDIRFGEARPPGTQGVNILTPAYDGSVPSKRTIAHLDMDSFYVAVELLRRPELRGKPVIVAGAGPRAVVTTASYEARPFGVGSAQPVSQARRRCPDLIHLPVDMAHYRERSREVMELVGELDVPTQPVSLDEVYLDLSDVPDPIARMSGLVKAIRERLGLHASVGMGPNRLVAKVASDAEKPRGFVVLTREQAAQRFAPEPPRLIPGIGPKTAERLESLGVRTIGELQAYPPGELVRLFGNSHGRALHERAHFRDDSAVERGELKSRSVETTFDYDIPELPRLEQVLGGQVARLAAELAERNLRGRTIGIKVRLDDWTTVTRVHTIDAPTNDAAVIGDTALSLLRAYNPPRPVRLLGVRVASFSEAADGPAAGPLALTLLDAA